MIKHIKRTLKPTILLIGLITSSLAFATLPVPKNLIAFDSDQGKVLFARSLNNPFWKLMPYFTTENGLTFCSIASATMVLNALNIQPPSTPAHAPFRIFEQDNFFTDAVLKITNPPSINMQGMTLKQLWQSIQTFGVKTEIVYGYNIDKNNFRKNLIAAIRSKNQYIIVNFNRKYLHQVGAGHFSPLAAYDEKTDRFLLLDVARYKYPATWVKTDDLFQAIRLDANGEIDNQRGYLVVSPLAQ